MTTSPDDTLTDVFVECRLPDSLRSQIGGQHNHNWPCLMLRRVQWLETVERKDSNQVLCHFRAPDAESVRVALRNMDIEILGVGPSAAM